MTRRSGFVRLTALAAVGVLAACSSDVMTAPNPVSRQADIQTPTDPFLPADNTKAFVCVVSPIAGNYDFDVSTTGSPTGVVDPATVTPGNCVQIATAGVNSGFGNPDGITTALTSSPAGATLTGITKDQAVYSNQSGIVLQSVTTTNVTDPVTGRISNEEALRITYTFGRTPGNEGCTPGYWKQEHHFDSWVGYTPTQTLEDVFDVPNSLGVDNVTLVDALSFPGGKGVQGGAQILLRAAVASLLNTNAVQFPINNAQLIADVNAALATLDRNTMITLGGQLDGANNGLGGCPLN